MQNEKISLLMDDEFDDKALFESIFNNKETMENWRNYHLIRDVLQNHLHESVVCTDLAESVLFKIKQDENKVIKLSTYKKLKNAAKKHISTFAQIGIVASTAFFIVIGFNQYIAKVNEEDDLPILSTVPVGMSVEPVGYEGFRLNYIDDKENDDVVYQMLQDYERQRRVHQLFD